MEKKRKKKEEKSLLRKKPWEDSRKEEKKEEGKEVKKENRNKQTKIAVIVMIALIASILLSHWIIQESKTFDYDGMKFHKYKEDNVIFYQSEVMNYVSHTGFSISKNIPFTIKLRDDPRELRKIQVEGTVILNQQKDVVLSVSPELVKCNSTHRTLMDYAWTLSSLGFNVSLSTPDKEYSKANNMSFVTCLNNSKGRSVILMLEGNETKIIEDNPCFIIEISNCEMQESFGRFILEFIANSIRKANV